MLSPNQTRVLLRPFDVGDPERTEGIIHRVMALPEDEVGPLLEEDVYKRQAPVVGRDPNKSRLSCQNFTGTTSVLFPNSFIHPLSIKQI